MSNPFIDEFGDTYWYNSERQLHRLDGPAIEAANGSKLWYKEDKLHRLDGPAVDSISENKEWWVDEFQVTEADFPQAVLLYKCKQILES